MCGIVALHSSSIPVSEISLKRGIDCLKHRGPDGVGIWISSDKKVALGHTRLSIIDINYGEQPISNDEENLHIIVNGEFYGFEQTQSDLRKLGYKLKTNSDSEIALHLYNELGTQCLHHLRGEFSFVLWDFSNKLLFAARDRFGIKPLYYSVHNNTLYIASEIKALLAAGIPARWDYESFWQSEQTGLPPDRTMFANIYQVPAGHFLTATDNGVKLHKYWDFNYPQIAHDDLQKSPDFYVEQLRHTLEEAVRIRLRADVPVGCYLSGGLDSSALLGIAAKYSSKPINAFTLAFDEEEYNEEFFARETALLTGANLNVIPICQADLADNFSDSIWHSETLSVNAGTTAKYILSRAVQAAGYKVVLTGEGADEIFGGYAHFRQDMILHNQQGQDKNHINELLQALKSKNNISAGLLLAEGKHTESLQSVQRLLGFIPSWMQIFSEGFIKNSTLYSQDFISQFHKMNAHRNLFNALDVQGQLTNRDPVNQSLYLWSKTILPNYLLRMLGDGVEMAHSIEGRLPFLDHKVVELVASMPVSLKIRGVTEKYVLKEAAKPFITESMYQRQKHPFLAPPSMFKPNEPFQQLIQDTLRSSNMSKIPFYSHAAIIELLDYLPKMDKNSLGTVDVALIKMLSASFLQERFGM